MGLLACVAVTAYAGDKEVPLSSVLKGEIPNPEPAKDAPAFLADAKAYDKLWKQRGLQHKRPDVDFRKEIVLVGTTVGSEIDLVAKLDRKGNLKVVAMATSDFRPGLRYVFATVPRAGVKTVNGKRLSAVRKRVNR